MSSYLLTALAQDDLFEIWIYIAQQNRPAADRVEDAILAACEFLAGAPLAGHVRRDLTEAPVRFWLVKPFLKYFVVYNPETKPLQVIRILHGARDISTILR